ncbi:hypothetical protein SprV_0902796700 [Sparganum proliferum]
MMVSCRNPKRKANKALVSAIVSPSSRHLPGTRLFASIRSSLKSDFGRSAAELLFGTTIRLPDKLISPTPPHAFGDPTNPLHLSDNSCGHFPRFRSDHPSPSLILRKVWRYALTFIADVIESAGLSTQLTTPPTKSSPEDVPHSMRNSRGSCERGQSQSCRPGHFSGGAFCSPFPCSTSAVLYPSLAHIGSPTISE